METNKTSTSVPNPKLVAAITPVHVLANLVWRGVKGTCKVSWGFGWKVVVNVWCGTVFLPFTLWGLAKYGDHYSPAELVRMLFLGWYINSYNELEDKRAADYDNK